MTKPADRRAAWRRLLPIALIALVTLIVLAGVSEGTARLLFSASPPANKSCLILDDRQTGARAVPNSHCQEKSYESALVDYRFNPCGLRTPQPCGPAPAGTYRIVMIGSSMAYGSYVQQDESFAGLLGPMLSKRLRRPVDVFNEAMVWGMPARTELHVDEMLAAKPDMILWPVSPFDIDHVGLVLPGDAPTLGAKGASSARPQPLPALPPSRGLLHLPGKLWKAAVDDTDDFRSILMLRHYLYRNHDEYLVHAVVRGTTADYLRVPPPAAYQANLDHFSEIFARIAARTRAAGVPLVVTVVPAHPQAVMLADRHWDKDFDPNAFGVAIRRIVEANGGRYVDILPGAAATPALADRYMPVDEHPGAAGHKILADLIGDAMLRSGVLPQPEAAKAAR